MRAHTVVLAALIALLCLAGCASSYNSYTRYPAKAKAYRQRYQPYCGKLRTQTGTSAPRSEGTSKASVDVRGVMRENAAAVHACFTEAVSIWPDLEGDAVLRLNIDERGSAQSFAVGAETPEIRSVGCCVGEAALGWNFHEQPAQVAVQFRVEFHNDSPQPALEDVSEWPSDSHGTIYDPRMPGSEDRQTRDPVPAPATLVGNPR